MEKKCSVLFILKALCINELLNVDFQTLVLDSSTCEEFLYVQTENFFLLATALEVMVDNLCINCLFFIVDNFCLLSVVYNLQPLELEAKIFL